MITHDPYELRVGGVEMYVDLGAEQLIAAERDQIKIAIEVKSFIGASAISEFHNAHGQFLDYRFALEEEEPDRKLFLAVPVKTYRTFFSLRFIQTSQCERRQNLGSIMMAQKAASPMNSCSSAFPKKTSFWDITRPRCDNSRNLP